jgi:DNA-binding FrmR family transcriptional regulator
VLEPQLHKNLSKRLHYIGGQLNSIDKMLAENRPLPDMLVQLFAVEGGLQKFIYQHFDEAFRKELALRINTLLENQKLNAQHITRLEEIKKQFPNIKLRQLPKIIFEIEQIEKNLPA